MKVYVVADAYNWMTPVPGVPGRWQHNTARRGDQLDLDQAEADRGLALNALSTDAAAVAAAEAAAVEPAMWSDEQLGDATVDQLVAYMGQRPSEAERVLALEETRERPRKGVMDAAGRISAERDAALADLAEAREAEAEAVAGR